MFDDNSRWRLVRPYLLLIGWSVIVLTPLYWVLITSFKHPIDVTSEAKFVPWLDFEPTTASWLDMLGDGRSDWMRPFTNSLLVATISSALALILSATAGYALARFTFRARRIKNADIAFWFISQRMFPPVALVLPYLVMYKNAHLLDTRLGLIIAYVAMGIPLGVWITRDFFQSLPVELEESALVDGMSRFQVFRKVVLPLASPGLFAAFMVIFIFTWNEYVIALMLTLQNAVTMPVFIFTKNSSLGPEWASMSAIAIVAMAPVILIGLLLSKYLDRAVLSGSHR